MKKLSIINKIIFAANILLAVATFVGYLLPFLMPKIFPILSVFTLFLPLLLISNLLFIAYWIFRLKKQFMLSLIVFTLGYLFFADFYQFRAKTLPKSVNDFTLMSYNVRLFNLFNWVKIKDVPQRIETFVHEQAPDIVCLQEFSKKPNLKFSDYPFQHTVMYGNKIKTGQAIFSKFRIIDKGEIALPKSDNNVIYADIIKESDTIRVYSIHLQSINISPEIQEPISENTSRLIFSRISKAFKEQQVQSELIKSHMQDFKGKKIICGDMNNSAFSYVYKNVKGDLKDAFVEAGKGFGATYNFKYYPSRIDYILVDDIFQVKEFETFSNFKNSDHFPIKARISLTKSSACLSEN